MFTSGRSRLHLAHVSGQLIGGKYRIEQQLGQGPLSAVYRAQRIIGGAPVTLTMFLLPDNFSALENSRFLSRFSQEATALLSLTHPSILPTYDYGEYGGYPYLVSGYVEGESLADMLKARGRCTMQEALSVLEQIAPALDYAHQHGVIHRALKPANLLFSGNEIYLAGFGLARMIEREGLNQEPHPSHAFLSIAGTYIGSPEYLAPERITGQPVGARADLYALGMILFEMLTGKPPFTGDDFLQVARAPLTQPFPSVSSSQGLPSTLDAVFHRATNYLPELRFEQAKDLVAAYITAAGPHLLSTHQTDALQLTEPSVLVMRERYFADPLIDPAALPINEAPELVPHRTVGLSDLRLAPWLEQETLGQGMLASDEAGSLFQISEPGDIAGDIERLLESALAAQVSPENSISQVSTERVVALAHSTPAPGRQRLTMLFAVRVEATVDAISRLFAHPNEEAQAPRAFIRQQAFSAISGNFPTRPSAFVSRQDTFPSSRDHKRATNDTIVDALPASHSNVLPHLASSTI